MENQLLIIFFIIVYFKNSLFWTTLWQIKEYRLDRFLDFISTTDGQKSLFNKSFAWELFGLIILILTETDFLTSKRILIFFLLAETLYWLWQISRKQFIKPVWTNKALLISALSLLLATIVVITKIIYFPEKF